MDFIKSLPDTSIYNYYKTSLDNGDFFRALRIINDKAMPAISNSEKFTPEQIAQAKADLLLPITKAAEDGNQAAISALNARSLPPTQHVNAFDYTGRIQDRLLANRELLEAIDRSIEEKDAIIFEEARAALSSRILEGKDLSRDLSKDELIFLEKMEQISERFSRVAEFQRVGAPIPIAAPANDPEMVVDLVSDSGSVIDLTSDNEAEQQVIAPEKYEAKLKAELVLHHRLVGALNLAIADNDIESIKTSAKALNGKLKESGLTKEEIFPLKADVGRVYGEIVTTKAEAAPSVNQHRIPEAVAAQALAAVSSSSRSPSPDADSTELDSPAKRMRIDDSRGR